MKILIERFRRNVNYVLCSGIGFAVALSLGGCAGDSGDTTNTNQVPIERSVQLVPTTNPAELEAYLKAGLRESSGMDRDLSVFQREENAASGSEDASTDATAPIALEDSDSSSVQDGGAGGQFSTTNLQEAGVDEADLVKYDGDYIYVADNFSVFAVSQPLPVPLVNDVAPLAEPVAAQSVRQINVGGDYPPSRIIVAKTQDAPAGSETVATVTLEESFNIDGIYLFSSEAAAAEHADRLVVLGKKRSRCNAWQEIWCWQQGNTTVLLYDVSTPAAPELVSRFETNAHRIATRRVGNQLYLTTRHAPYLANFATWVRDIADIAENEALLEGVTIQQLLPKAWVNGVEQPLVRPENCFIPPQALRDVDRRQYYRPAVVGITQLDLTDLTPVASVCTAGAANGLYASRERLFLYGQMGSETVVHGFELSDAGPAYQGSGAVSGNIGWQNQTFRFSAVGDYLRVISSEGEDHQLTVLEHNPAESTYEPVATLPNDQRPAPIGKPNESIYGVRFMQDRAYVVTFERTDPLYVINLSNPEDPFIEGELEMPGFSDYLHPINDYLLLGIGHAANDDGLQQGVKIALFDVSNPAAPSILSEAEIGDRGSRTPVSYDHKALTWLANAETGVHRLGLPVRKFELVPEQGVIRARGVTVLSLWEIEDTVTAGRLQARGEIEALEHAQVMRGILDGPSVHFVADDAIVSADWLTPASTSINANKRVDPVEEGL